VLALLSACFAIGACGHKPVDPYTVTIAIESSPANLDPRIGNDLVQCFIAELEPRKP